MPLDLALIRSARPRNALHYFRSIGSTMTEGARLALEGAPHGTVVLAEEQVAGIGRMGRRWDSQLEVGLYSSTLLRLPLAPENLPIASLLLGLAVAEAIQNATGLSCDLRWPNDVLLQERKVAGILPHLVAGCVVAGIGINVSNTSFDAALRTPAISLAQAAGHTIAREAVLIALLAAIDNFCDLLVKEGPSAILKAFSRASSYVSRRRVVIEETGCSGTTVGLDDSGFLLLQHDSGKIERIASGGVRPLV